jgi:trk system potassium uptake protein TrkH
VAGTLLLSLPFARAGDPLALVDALFTATSAVCVTGLTVVASAS